MLSPYVDILSYPQVDLAEVSRATGIKNFHLAFITSDSAGNPSWGSQIPLSEAYYFKQVTQLRKMGIEFTISFGGANNQDLALTNRDPVELEKKVSTCH